jgi:hypothetical protein
MTTSRFFLAVAAAMSLSASVGLAQLAHAQGVTAPAGPSADVAGRCETTKLAFKTLTTLDTTTSASFAPMPRTQRSITTSASGCVIVDFSGEQFGGMEIQAFASSLVGEPPFVVLGRPVFPTQLETNAMRFVFSEVPAGTYNVGIAWRSQTAGNTVLVQNRILTIEFR